MAEFRIRSFKERASYGFNDYLVTGVSTIEEAAKKLASVERTLARMASRDDFAAYVTRSGAELQWGIPGPAPE